MIELSIFILMQTFIPSSNAILNQSYYNISSATQLFQYTNAGTGGLEELFLCLLLYFVFMMGGVMAGRFNLMMSALGAALLMVPISLFAQAVFGAGGGAVGALLPLIFIAISVITAMVGLLSGFLSPYQ